MEESFLIFSWRLHHPIKEGRLRTRRDKPENIHIPPAQCGRPLCSTRSCGTCPLKTRRLPWPQPLGLGHLVINPPHNLGHLVGDGSGYNHTIRWGGGGGGGGGAEKNASPPCQNAKMSKARAPAAIKLDCAAGQAHRHRPNGMSAAPQLITASARETMTSPSTLLLYPYSVVLCS